MTPSPGCLCGADDSAPTGAASAEVCPRCGRPVRASSGGWLPHAVGPEYRGAGRPQGAILLVCGVAALVVNVVIALWGYFFPYVLMAAPPLIVVGVAVLISPRIGDAMMGTPAPRWAKVVGVAAGIVGIGLGFWLVAAYKGVFSNPG